MSAPVTDETRWASGSPGSENAPGASLKEEVAWANGVGARLKVLLSSFAGDDANARREYLSEELNLALKAVSPSRRRIHLQALAEQFPAWEGAPSHQQRAADDTPEAILEKLVEVAPYLSVEQKKAFAERLQAAGIVTVREVSVATPGAIAGSEPIPADLQKKLGLREDQALVNVRVVRMIALLIEFSVTLDQVAWSMWRQIAPKSIVRREGPEGDLRKIAGPYLAGDDEVSTTQIAQVLDKTRQLIAGLLAGIGATGETFARRFLSRFAPPAIQQQAEAESGFFIGPEQKCWRRYVTLFGEINGVAVEKEISAVIAKCTEDLVLGADRSGSHDT